MADRIPDQANVPGSTWNESGQLWNDNQAKPTSYNYLRRVAGPGGLDKPAQFTKTQTPPKILRDFSATQSDIAAKMVQDSVVDVPRDTLVGSFAAVRAARVLHQYAIGFWSDSGIIETVSSTTKADPSAGDIATMYNNFLLFSYLPPQLTPTATEFADLVTPSKTPANIQNALAKMGILTTPNATAQRNLQTVPPNQESLPTPVPYANSLSTFCVLP